MDDKRLFVSFWTHANVTHRVVMGPFDEIKVGGETMRSVDGERTEVIARFADGLWEITRSSAVRRYTGFEITSTYPDQHDRPADV